MSRHRLIVPTLAVVALLLAACGSQTAGQGTDAAPTETVTVTETVTPAGEPSPDSTTTTDAEPAAGEGCAESRSEYAFTLLTSPEAGAEVSSPFTAEGCANAFEANVQYRLIDRDGDVIAEGFTTASCGSGCVGDFMFEVEFQVDEAQMGTLETYETSAEDGSEINVHAVPVLLQP